MIQSVASVTVYIRDEDEALAFYTDVLGFQKRMDVPVKPGTRWLTVAPPSGNIEIVLHRPAGWHSPEAAAKMDELIGRLAPMVLNTDNCRADYERLVERGVRFSQEPKEQMYGVEAVFEDLYGNSYVLVEPKAFQP